MKKIAVLLADGFEEGEGLFVVDVLRRAGFTCDMVSITDNMQVTGSHDITTITNKVLDDSIKEYDMLVLPGGMPGSTNLRDSNKVIEMVQYFNQTKKYIAAICAAPIVLQQAGVIKGRKVTSYPSQESVFVDSEYVQDIVVIDEHIITSRGPATVLSFAYTLVDILGGNSEELKQGMLYNMVKGN